MKPLRTLATHATIGFAATLVVSALGYICCSECSHRWVRWMRVPVGSATNGVMVNPELLVLRRWSAARFLLSDTYFCTEDGPGVSARFAGDGARFAADAAAPTSPPSWTDFTTANPASAPARMPGHILRVGFPLRSFEAASEITVIAQRNIASMQQATKGVDSFRIAEAFHSYGRYAGVSSEAITLPVAPRWMGLLVDGAVWACTSFILATLLTHARRWLERRLATRTLCCTACGYSLNGLPAASACPECGKPGATTS